MKLSTTIIPTVEVTKQEQHELWEALKTNPEQIICGKKLRHWNTNDGNNEMLLEGEDFYRAVVTIKN